jgi:perosamine synthetase
MKIGRSLPPAAAPLGWMDLWNGIVGALTPNRSLRLRERELGQEFGVAHVFLLSSGTAALQLALRSVTSLSIGTHVVIPAYTCFSVPAAILKTGLRPVLCDIDPSTFDFDHALLQDALTPSTLCVIAHHLFGVPSDINRTRDACRARGIFLIEDAAQALGVDTNGGKAGTVGDMGIFSFGRGKNVTCGSGGAIITSSDRLARAVEAEYREVPSPRWWESLADVMTLVLMMIFIRPSLYWIPAALPFLQLGTTVYPENVVVRRLSGFKAGLLRNWRRHLARSNQVRSETTADLRRRLPGATTGGASYPLLRLPLLAATPEEKQQLHSRSKVRGLGLSLAYPTAVNEIPDVRAVVNGQQFPSAAAVASRLLTLPTHHWLLEKDKRALADLCLESRAS